ncbi:MAG: EAL domain-containing protein [Myxococcales bacterium]|nr:EAL domain-containing protein [Myxococcales bacterium]MCB9735615.1 EAL domain-containing protein [Deltaproteobacteria bacterium]
MLPTVLFLDDEPELTRGVARALRKASFRVVTANSVEDARTVLAREEVHVVVSDERMPDMSGSSFLSELRTEKPDVTRILLTGHGDLDVAQSAINRAEIFRFLRKPCPPDELESCLTEALTARDRYLAWAEHEQREHARQSTNSTFGSALGGLWLAMQPIVRPDGTLFAYEALARVPHGTFRGPLELFESAHELHRTTELERAVRANAALLASQLPAGLKLFVNVEPSSLGDAELYDDASPLSRVASRVVLEITERAPLRSIVDLEGRIARLREMGFMLALDDFGAGSAGFTAFATLRPDVAKLDMDMVRGIDKSDVQQRTVRSMIHLCKDLGVMVLGEGVETDGERETLRELGVELLQGYLVGKPAPPPPVGRQSEG